MISEEGTKPTKELLEKVIFIADVRSQLPISERAHLNDWGVYCRVNRLPGGSLLYQAGGKFITRLRASTASTRLRKSPVSLHPVTSRWSRAPALLCICPGAALRKIWLSSAGKKYAG